MSFVLKAPFKPAKGQIEAIKKLVDGAKKYPLQTLLGITGSGKTFVMANVIEKLQKPTLVLAHNKTLAAQLYQEFKEFFPNNAVEYFISYYDYYQPESYIPTTDTYIEKEATVNKQIEKMRLKAMASLLSRKDVIVVASVSCIYGAGNPQDFAKVSLSIEKGEKKSREEILGSLVRMLYERNEAVVEEGYFRVRGDVIDIYPSYMNSLVRIELFGDVIEKISFLHPVTGQKESEVDSLTIFPAKQFVIPEEKHERAIEAIKEELKDRLSEISGFEAERLKKKVQYDLEMINEVGYCNGIENYSRHFDERAQGEPPFALLDYFPEDFLFIIDESHQTIPQLGAMYKGDYARKKNLIDYGFRLPSAFDNRPLKFAETEKHFKQVIFVSATPAQYEMQKGGQLVELILRPTGLLDPTVEVRPSDGQIANLIDEIRAVKKRNERVLVTTLTKRMAEDLTNYLAGENISVRYMHADIESLERIELLRGLRAGDFDVLVGINLLREGLDLPEVSLVAILDADKEGFLRDERSLIQTFGRAARNVHGQVILYADKITMSMRKAMEITKKRRMLQIEHNKKEGITPMQIIKEVAAKTREVKTLKHLSDIDKKKRIAELEAEMRRAAENLDFEKAIELRDVLKDVSREQWD